MSITDAEDTIEAQAAAQTGQKKVRIRIDESNIQTSYVSGFRPTMGPEELMLEFGLSSLQELPSLQEFEEITRAAMGEPSAEQSDTGDATDPASVLSLSEQAPSEQSLSEQSLSGQAGPSELRSKAAQSAAAGGSESSVSDAAREKLHDPVPGDTDGA